MQALAGEAALRGAGVPFTKSLALLFVSTHESGAESFFRVRDSTLLRTVAGVASEQMAAPVP